MTSSAAHRSDDFASPFTAGSSNNLSPEQFHGMYVRNQQRNQYRSFMRAKSPYRRSR
jgi:hypothetical protein